MSLLLPRSTLFPYTTLFRSLQKEVNSSAPADFLQSILLHSGYFDMLMNRDSSEDTARADNLHELVNAMAEGTERGETDRKSTRLNSSHSSISYAVFCLKKKK